MQKKELQKRIKFFCSPGKNVNVLNDQGYTLLMCCVGENYRKGVQELLDARADVNFAGGDGNTALHLACFFGNMHLVQLFIDHLAYLDVENMYGVTPLGMACINKQIDVIKYLLSVGVDPSQGAVTPLQICLIYHCHDIVYILLEARADPRIYRKEFKDIQIPCSKELQEAVKILGERNVSSPIDFVHKMVLIFTMEYKVVDKIDGFYKMLTHMCQVIKPFDWSEK